MSVRLWNIYYGGRAKQVFDQKLKHKKEIKSYLVNDAESTEIWYTTLRIKVSNILFHIKVEI